MTAAPSSGAAADLSGGLRFFSGESEDGKEYKRWKLWITNKMRTMDKLGEEARGSFVFTCLSGKAFEAIEHLDPSKYQCKQGEDVIFKLLDRRFPEKDTSDQLAEVLNDIFTMKVQEGENLRQWISRATEIFEKCERKSGCKFPTEAQGYMILKGSGLSEEQQAVVKGRSLGDMTLDNITKSMRSVYPDFVHRRKHPAALVEDAGTDFEVLDFGPDEQVVFEDVEAFLTEHLPDTFATDQTAESYPEAEVAEVLAVTWKEKRAELSRLQRSRRFSEAKDVKRRCGVEELKKKTRCNRPLGQGMSSASRSQSTSSSRWQIF